MTGRGSRIRPEAPGYWTSTPETLAVGQPLGEVGDDDLDAHRLGASADHLDRLRQRVGVDHEGPVQPWLARRTSVIASAAAVPSSSSDAFAVDSPVRSLTMVWKFSSASSRPWLISGWYGV